VRRLIVVGLVLVATIPAVVAGAQVNASITDVQVAPSSPAPGETVTFRPTIQNFGSSGDSLDITAVALRQNGVNELDRVRNLGTLSPGATVTIPLTTSFESSGTRDLRIYVYGVNADTGNAVQLRYPVSLTVRERHPQIDVQADDSVAGVASNGTVTVANGLDTDISNVEVNVSGEGVTMLDSRTVFASVSEGETITAPYRFRPDQSGDQRLRATLSYTLPNGTDRTVTQNRTIETDEPDEDGVIVEVSGQGTGTDQTMVVDVLNQGNTPAEDVVVSATAENATVTRALIGSVAPGETEQVRLNASLSESRADVTVTAAYESGADERSTTTATTLRSNPGTIELTGLNVAREGGILQITGSTSNVGMTPTESVIVRVLPAENVRPAAPNRDFFVGEVPSSDFSSFDLTARPTGNVSSVPVEVSYLVDGERRTQTFSVAVNGGITGERQQQTNGGGGGGPGAGLLAVVGLGLVALLVVAGILVRRYRRDSDDEI
jgi:hypothetical protein